MEPIAVEIRAEILAACDAGEGTRIVAVRYGVSESWVRRVKQQRRESNQLGPMTAAPRQPEWKEWADWLVAKVPPPARRARERSGTAAGRVSAAAGESRQQGAWARILVTAVQRRIVVLDRS